jgi:hypothetical protein
MKNIHVLSLILCMHSTAYSMNLWDAVAKDQPKQNSLLTAEQEEELWRNLEKNLHNVPLKQNNQNAANVSQSVQKEDQPIAPKQNRYLKTRTPQKKSLLIPVTAKQNNQPALPDWKGMYSQLCIDYKNILKNKLEEYKKADISITPWSMHKLIKIGTTITKQNFLTLKSAIHTIRDEEGNVFLHHAVEKNDESTVSWLSLKSNGFYLSLHRNNGQTPFDLCIKKLLPEIPNDATKTATRKIFDILAKNILSSSKDRYLSQIIALQLKHKKYGTEFIVDQNLLQALIPSSPQKSLSNYYRDAQEEKDGYTFTHVFATQCKADDLFELVKKDQISFEKDKHNYTALDYALSALHSYIHNETNRAKFPDVCQKASCCVYILLNYAKELAQKGSQDVPADISDFGPCCEKHTLSKVI